MLQFEGTYGFKFVELIKVTYFYFKYASKSCVHLIILSGLYLFITHTLYVCAQLGFYSRENISVKVSAKLPKPQKLALHLASRFYIKSENKEWGQRNLGGKAIPCLDHSSHPYTVFFSFFVVFLSSTYMYIACGLKISMFKGLRWPLNFSYFSVIIFTSVGNTICFLIIPFDGIPEMKMAFARPISLYCYFLLLYSMYSFHFFYIHPPTRKIWFLLQYPLTPVCVKGLSYLKISASFDQHIEISLSFCYWIYNSHLKTRSHTFMIKTLCH